MTPPGHLTRGSDQLQAITCSCQGSEFISVNDLEVKGPAAQIVPLLCFRNALQIGNIEQT